MDFYAANAYTVDPLPFHTLIPYPYPAGTNYPTDADHQNYLLNYNTRPVADPAAPPTASNTLGNLRPYPRTQFRMLYRGVPPPGAAAPT